MAVNPVVVIILIVFIILIVAGIGGALYYVNKGKCEKSIDCEEDEICVTKPNETSGKCQKKCSTNGDCISGQVCEVLTGNCITGKPKCSTHSDCTADKACEPTTGLCHPRCVVDKCGTGNICDTTTWFCKCETNEGCGAGKKCDNGKCKCVTNEGCSGLICDTSLGVCKSAGTGLKTIGADCTTGPECQSGTCTGSKCVASSSSGGNTVGLVEGDMTKCNSPYPSGGSAEHTYVYTNNQLRWVPTQDIAKSWNPSYPANIKQVNCAGITIGSDAVAKSSTGGGSGTKVKGDPCSAGSECASGNCGPSTLTGFFKSFFTLGAPGNVCLDPSGNSLGLVEGNAVVCTEPYPSGGGPYHVYRYYTNGQLRHYPSEAIANSWDPAYTTARKTVNCTTLTVGAPMELKPGSTPSTFTLNNERLKNESNSKCLAVAGMGIHDGANLTTLDCETIGNHKNFTWLPTTELRNLNSSKYVTASGPASQLTQYPLRASPDTSQKWIYDADTKQFKNTIITPPGYMNPGYTTVLCMELVDDVIPKVSGMPCDSSKSSQRWTKV